MASPPDDILDLLAAYALDALEPQEIARLVALLDEQPELRSTLAELRATANQLPYALPEVEPPADLRQRVLDRATGRAVPSRPAPQPSLTRQARGWLFALGSLAAVAIILAVIGWAQLAGTQTELASTQTELTRVRGELLRARQEQQQVTRTLLAADTIAKLQGQGSGALLRAPDGGAVLAAQLPPLKPGRVYQLWLIQGQNPPLSAGIFTVDQQGNGVLALPPGARTLAGATIAVTDEPDPGSPGPTTQPLIVGELPAA